MRVVAWCRFPVCFLLHTRHVLFNFLYRSPKPLSHLRTPTDAWAFLDLVYWFRLGLHWLLTRDPTMQSCFRREFWWVRHWMHPSDLPSPSHVVLSGRDAIVPAHDVADYLVAKGGRRTSTRCGGGASSDCSSAGASGGASAGASGGASRGGSERGRRLQVELHEHWQHGQLMACRGHQRRLIAELASLMGAQDGVCGGGGADPSGLLSHTLSKQAPSKGSMCSVDARIVRPREGRSPVRPREGRREAYPVVRDG